MMSGVPLETCWAFSKLWNNKFHYKAPSCWYFYWVIKRIFKKWDEEARSELIWLRIDRWRALVNAVMNFGFHKTLEISWPSEDLLASQKGLCSIELVQKLHSWFCSGLQTTNRNLSHIRTLAINTELQ